MINTKNIENASKSQIRKIFKMKEEGIIKPDVTEIIDGEMLTKKDAIDIIMDLYKTGKYDNIQIFQPNTHRIAQYADYCKFCGEHWNMNKIRKIIGQDYIRRPRK